MSFLMEEYFTWIILKKYSLFIIMHNKTNVYVLIFDRFFNYFKKTYLRSCKAPHLFYLVIQTDLSLSIR